VRSLEFLGGGPSTISSDFFHSLFESLRINTSLENLDFQGIDMDEHFARNLFSALAENQHLSKLRICIKVTKVSEVFEIIEHYLQSSNGGLEWFRIYGCGGEIRNAASFLESLTVNRHLRFLWVDKVRHKEQITIESFKEKFQANRSLVQVRFPGIEGEEIFLESNGQSFLSEIKSLLCFRFRHLSTDLNMYREILAFLEDDNPHDIPRCI
jgi:hypothetical protein